MRETGNVERELTEEISEIKRFIKDRYGEVTLDEMVRRISVICNKLNDAILEKRRNKLTEITSMLACFLSRSPFGTMSSSLQTLK